MKTFKQFLAEASQSQLKQWTEYLVSKDGLEETVANALIQYWKDIISKLPNKTISDLIENSNIKDVDPQKMKDVLSFIPTKKRPTPLYNFKVLETIVDLHKASQAVKGKEEVNVDENSDDIIYNKNNLIIKKGHSKTSCIRHGKGYSWCISRPDASNLYNKYRYQDEATFYFVLDKDKPTDDPYHHFVIYLLPNGTYMVADADNQGDKQMSWNEIVQKQPKLKGLEKLFKYHPVTSEERELYKRFKNEISDEEFLRLNLQEMEFYLSLGHKLSENVLLQLFGSKAKKQILNKYINHHYDIPKTVYDKVTPAQKKKIEENQLAAVKKNAYLIQNIIKAGIEPSEAVQLAAVKQDGYLIRYIKNPTEAVQLAAMKQDGFAIQYIKNPKDAVQLAAVEQDGDAIQYIKNPTEAVQLAAVKQDGYLIKDIIKAGYEPSEAVQLAAVKNNGGAIVYIKNPTPKVIQYVIDHHDKKDVEKILSYMERYHNDQSQAKEKLQKAFDEKYK